MKSHARRSIAVAALLAGWCALGATPALADLVIPPAHGQGQGHGDKGKPDDKGKPGDKGKPDDKGPAAAAASGQASAAAAVSGAPSAGPAASGNPSANPSADPAASADAGKAKRADRKERAKKDRDQLKAKVEAKLKNQPMAQAFKEQLKLHARRVARITRIKEVAQAEKDDATVARCDELLKKEQERHDKWLANYDAKGGAK